MDCWGSGDYDSLYDGVAMNVDEGEDMFNRRNIDRIMLILFCLAFLVWCFLGIRALPTLRANRFNPS